MSLSLAADLLLAILLVATIASSFLLSRRVLGWKAEEAGMHKAISELTLATETAEQTIAKLRTTVEDCDRVLADRLRMADGTIADLADHVVAGQTVIDRIAQIVESARRAARDQRTAEEVQSNEPARRHNE